LLPAGVLTTDSRLVLTNAIYFKAKWHKAFAKANTRDRDFTLSSGATTKKPMMTQADTFGYAETGNLQILELPYVGKEFSLVVLLPGRSSTLADLETKMAKELPMWISKLSEQEVIVTVPRFEMTTAMSMKDTLSRMGMSKAFALDADFSGIDDGRDQLVIGDVIHKAFVEVSEAGTEAAAATAVEIGAPLSAPNFQPRRPPEFTADRPFAYLLRDRQTGAILFMGRYVGT
jgi:serpin B